MTIKKIYLKMINQINIIFYKIDNFFESFEFFDHKFNHKVDEIDKFLYKFFRFFTISLYLIILYLIYLLFKAAQIVMDVGLENFLEFHDKFFYTIYYIFIYIFASIVCISLISISWRVRPLASRIGSDNIISTIKIQNNFILVKITTNIQILKKNCIGYLRVLPLYILAGSGIILRVKIFLKE